ncbi:MAG: acyl--CoA ligase, partial [Methanobrevibacter sp.]|nr:acyl--CoA ligase [Methanobrevibacter sp.]
MLNITTFIDANARRLDKDVYYCPSRDLRYNSTEILQIVSGIGQSLKNKGIEKGDRVLIYLNNSPEYLFSLLAIWRIGAIAIPTNRILTSSELNYMITDSDAKLLITDDDAEETIKNLNIEAYIIENCESFIGSEVLAAEETEWDDLCQLQYTSGTTGKPKGSMLTHGNWFTAIHNACDVLTYKENDTFLCIYPMAHVGIMWAIAALRAGALTITMDFFEINEYLELCKNEEVSVLSGMPPVIHTLTNLEEEKRENLSTVREIISGGGPLHRKIWKKFMAQYNIPIINAYGLSESIVIGTGTVIRPEDYATADRYESVGHPVCFSELK